MKYNVMFTDFARESFDDIYNYVKEKTSSLQSAKNTANLIRTEVERLSISAKIGINFDKKIGFQMIPNHTTYMFIAKQYLIFYVIINSNVYVLDVVNGKTDYLSKLEKAVRYARKELNGEVH